MNTLVIVFLWLIPPVWANGSTPSVKVPLPPEVSDLHIGMSMDQLLTRRPKADSFLAIHLVMEGATTEYYKTIRPGVPHDTYSEDLEPAADRLFDDASYMIRGGELAGIKLSRRLPSDTTSYLILRESLIETCFDLWGREQSLRVEKLKYQPAVTVAVLEWRQQGLRIILGIPIEPPKPWKDSGADLEILTSRADAFVHVDAKMSKEKQQDLWRAIGLERIWEKVKHDRAKRE